ncbi:hypothetical protein GCM10010970_25320 [Silvimonas iriomotensis]|uniref:FtsK domain-containing protein n=2 Tax=Silvimonas iriomotensis TaxID=449662 RepID=A0ABQ2PAR7_9NEIS|nr:hypothetical protein GCM10010970_25320 [Silvimonas iriomotensis]
MAFIFQISHWPQWWHALLGIGGWWVTIGAGIATWQALRQQPLRITRPGWRSAAGYALLIVSGALAGHLILATGHPALGLIVLAAGTGAGIPLWAGLRWNALTELVSARLEHAIAQLTNKLPVTMAEAQTEPPAQTVPEDVTPEPAPAPAAAAPAVNLRSWFTRTWSEPAPEFEHSAEPGIEASPQLEDLPEPAFDPAYEAHQAALTRAAEKLDTRRPAASVNTVPAGSPLPVITLDKSFPRAAPAPAPKPLPVLGREQVLQPPRYLSRQPAPRPAPAPQADLPRIDANEIRARLQSMHGHRDTQRIATQHARQLDQTAQDGTKAASTPAPIVVRSSRTVSNADDAVFISARRPVQRSATVTPAEEPAPLAPVPMPVVAAESVVPETLAEAEATPAPRYQSGRTIRTAQSYTAPPEPVPAQAITPPPAVEPAPMAPRPFWQRPLQAPDAHPVAPELVLPEMPVWQAPAAAVEAPAPVIAQAPAPAQAIWPAIQDVPLPAIEETTAEHPAAPVVAPVVVAPVVTPVAPVVASPAIELAVVAVAPPATEPAAPAFTPMRWQPMPWEDADEDEAQEAALAIEPELLPPAAVPLQPPAPAWQSPAASVAAELAASGDYQPSAWATDLINRPAPAPVPPPRPLYDESCLPSLDLLLPPAQAIDPISQDELIDRGIVIEEKLAEFKVKVSVLDAFAGPVITRYEVEPAVGVRGAQVVNLMKDLARALGLVSIRVVETIPGKTCMGLELPNPTRQMIRLSEILSSEAFHTQSSRLTMALGKDITGKPIVTDLAKAPHMLVAGTTGSGKSVGVNAMILSLLYKATPDEVRFIMVDPKMLELSVYDGIPHLLAPVVTDMKLAANALNWCVAEMEKRYRLMSAMGVRNLAGFNQKVKEAEKAGKPLSNPFSLTPDNPEPLTHLPFVVVVVDEFADLMMVAGKKIEELIARLAQKARAAGIHLILATQRPSVDVITGLIKANIPTRVAFQVSSKIDSRTILDQMGAEALLGQGDMLFLPPGTGYPQRVHGAFVADDEVHRVVEYLKTTGEPDYVEGILNGGLDAEAAAGSSGAPWAEAGGEESDPLYDEAVSFVLKSRRASISSVQRQLRIGYNRAARLIEQMENAGLVSAMESNGNRTVLAPAAGE